MAATPKLARIRDGRRWLCYLIVGVAFGSGTLRVMGLGDRIPNQDAEAIGRGNAFVATADNPMAMYYNPAGITQLEGNNIQAGALVYMDLNFNYESPSGEGFKNNRKFLPVPQFGYVYTPEGKPFSFGLGVYAPFGLGVEWPDEAPFRSGGLKSQLSYATVNPVVAWKVLPTLSLAAGPTLNYSEAELVQGVLVSPYQFHFKGHDMGYGFNAGVLWQPHAMWSFGARYFSETTLNYAGSTSFSPTGGLPPDMQTHAHLNFPQMVVGGVSFRPTTNWNFEVDVDWTGWDHVKELKLDGVGSLPLYWESSFLYEFGVTRQLGRGYYASAGYFYCEPTAPDKYYTPLVPDEALHVGSLGVGYKGAHWTWALAGQLIAGAWRDVQGAVNPTVDGRYKLWSPTISASVGYHF